MLSAGVGPLRGSSRGLAPIQWVPGVLIEAPDPLGIEPILTDLERSAGQRLRGQIFDGEANRVNGMGESLIADGLSPRHSELSGKQLRRCVVVERIHLRFPRARSYQQASDRQ
jgi:hypothetical protein